MNSYKEISSFIRSVLYEPKEFIPIHYPRFIGNEKKYLSPKVTTGKKVRVVLAGA